MCILCLVAAVQKQGYPIIRTYQVPFPSSLLHLPSLLTLDVFQKPCKRRLLAEFREFIEQRVHDISRMFIEEDNGEMLEVQQACVREFNKLERNFALESERMG